MKNIEHRTSNIDGPEIHSTFDVQCSMFDVKTATTKAQPAHPQTQSPLIASLLSASIFRDRRISLTFSSIFALSCWSFPLTGR